MKKIIICFYSQKKYIYTNNSMANIYIINKEKELSSEICYNKAYGNIESVYNEKKIVFFLKDK